MPLRSQVGAILAAEFGLRVQVEKTCLDDNGILVTGILAAATGCAASSPAGDRNLPPSGKSLGGWSGSLLQAITPGLVSPVSLPALSELQRAIAPESVKAWLPCLTAACFTAATAQVLAALGPLARINYLDASLFSQSSNSNSESIN